ncbi:MAG: AI-2E family transporter [Candidatus Nanopelagicales bacterium]|jgi:predicted PurR-regulated permease PerM
MSDAPAEPDHIAAEPPPGDVSPSDPGSNAVQVPETLKVWAGMTWRVLVILAGFGVLFLIMGQIAVVLVALFLAAFFTALASPIMSFLHRRAHLHRAIAMVLAIIIIGVAVVVVLWIVINSIINEAPALSKSIQQSFSEIQTWASGPPLNLSDDDFSGYVTEVENWGKNFALDIGSSALGSVGDIVLGGSVFIFGVIFFMMSRNSIWQWVISWMPTRSRPYVDTSGHLAWDSLSGYTRGTVVVALCDSILVFIGLLILQVPMAPALAAIVFFGAFIPVIGAPIATFFAAIVALAERGPVVAILVIGLTVVVGSFDGDVLQPLVMGKAVSLNPLAIIILIAIGSILLGIIGALVAVPIGASIYRVLKYLTNRDPEHPLPGHPPPEDPDTAVTSAAATSQD